MTEAVYVPANLNTYPLVGVAPSANPLPAPVVGADNALATADDDSSYVTLSRAEALTTANPNFTHACTFTWAPSGTPVPTGATVTSWVVESRWRRGPDHTGTSTAGGTAFSAIDQRGYPTYFNPFTRSDVYVEHAWDYTPGVGGAIPAATQQEILDGILSGAVVHHIRNTQAVLVGEVSSARVTMLRARITYEAATPAARPVRIYPRNDRLGMGSNNLFAPSTRQGSARVIGGAL